MTVLVAAPVVFLALFLFGSPVSKLVFPEPAQAKTVAVGSRTSVVVIVFDELSSGGLMDRRGHVDAVRFPNFGSLARQRRHGSEAQPRCTRTRSTRCRRS